MSSDEREGGTNKGFVKNLGQCFTTDHVQYDSSCEQTFYWPIQGHASDADPIRGVWEAVTSIISNYVQRSAVNKKQKHTLAGQFVLKSVHLTSADVFFCCQAMT
jgi:hypothetical protein